ncbi:MAG: carboxylating nicotinate-nucleotide diphosphorylase [Chloroflexia bacterium]
MRAVNIEPIAALGYNDAIEAIINLALSEDIGRGDITSESTVPIENQGKAVILQKAPGVLCGLPVVEAVFAILDPRVKVEALAEEGSWGDRREVARLTGPARALLTGERTALNFLQRLSGVATMSHRAKEAVKGTKATVLDTRKTTPGHRALEKYAVRVGGSHNHRAGLDDAVLIKDNHIRAAGGITAAVEGARKRVGPAQKIEVEVTNRAELDEALATGAEIIMLDNHTTEAMADAVKYVDGRVKLEASGGITLANLREVAETGVDYISLGALTHSAGSLDFSLEIVLD